MKKFLVVLLALVVAGGAFVQFKAEVTVDFVPDVLNIVIPTGDAAKTEVDVGGTTVKNVRLPNATAAFAGKAGELDGTGAANAVPGFNGYSSDLEFGNSQGAGSTNILSLGNYMKGNELRLPLSYTGENFKSSLQIKADDMIVAAAPNFAGTSPTSGQSLSTFLNQNFGDWFVQGTVGAFDAYVGNTANRGKVARFDGPFADLVKTSIGNYGILANNSVSPGSNAAGFVDPDSNNLPWQFNFGGYTGDSGLASYGRYNRPYLAVTYNINPFLVTGSNDMVGGMDENATSSMSA